MFDDLMKASDLDLSRFCEPSFVPPPELTEEELQEIEQRAEDWYMSMM